ncbi:MAG TPA: hypothetical protein VIL74_05655 [Pyrinomonadaceae bacterium]|jgi:hypothetical protein
MRIKQFIAAILLAAITLNLTLQTAAQAETPMFEKVELLVPKGGKISERSVRLIFLPDALQIEATADRSILKTFKYADIADAEYSYSKNPRWKTGLGLGAASVLFPPLLLVAIPLGFSKHRRHWLTVRTAGDYAVLKLSKNNRKLILPAFETKTGVNVAGKGENK